MHNEMDVLLYLVYQLRERDKQKTNYIKEGERELSGY